MNVRPVGARSLGPVSETSGQRPVFVYGTLRPGQPNWERLLVRRAARTAPGCLSGVDLLDCGHYPAAVERTGADGATGDVVWIEPRAWLGVLADLDHLEGYHPADPDRLYDRAVRAVDTADGPVECWVYVAGRVLAESGRPLVPGGDWVAHATGLPSYLERWQSIADAGGRARADG